MAHSYLHKSIPYFTSYKFLIVSVDTVCTVLARKDYYYTVIVHCQLKYSQVNYPHFPVFIIYVMQGTQKCNIGPILHEPLRIFRIWTVPTSSVDLCILQYKFNFNRNLSNTRRDPGTLRKQCVGLLDDCCMSFYDFTGIHVMRTQVNIKMRCLIQMNIILKKSNLKKVVLKKKLGTSKTSFCMVKFHMISSQQQVLHEKGSCTLTSS